MVVPAVRVVVGDDDRRARPGRRLLDRVDLVDEARLLVDRVRVAGVAVLVLAGLQERHRRQVARPRARPLKSDGRTGGWPGRSCRSRPPRSAAGAAGWPWTRSRRTGCGARRSRSGDVRDVLVRRSRRRLAGGTPRRRPARRRREAALEPAPGHARGVEQVADVLSLPLVRTMRVGARARARAAVEVGERVGVAVRGVVVRRRPAVAIGLPASSTTPLVLPVISLERPERRRAEAGAVGVVAHREVLRVVPHRGDGVAVEVVQHLVAACTAQPPVVFATNWSIRPPSNAFCSGE